MIVNNRIDEYDIKTVYEVQKPTHVRFHAVKYCCLYNVSLGSNRFDDDIASFCCAEDHLNYKTFYYKIDGLDLYAKPE